MLQAYFDESGTSGTEPLTVLSGFIATEQTWLEFDNLWHAALRTDLKDQELNWFHMVECENGKKQFLKWSSHPEVRRHAAVVMAEVIVNAGPTGFWSSVDVPDWDAVDDAAFKLRYPKPYHFCFEDCLNQVASWVREFAPGEAVEVIFAEQKEYKKRAKIIYDAYVKARPSTPIQSLRFAPMATFAPLQAADMAVYCTNKEMVCAIYGKDTRDRIYRSVLDVLYDNAASFTGQHRDALTLGTLSEP